MPYDEALAQRIRALLGQTDALAEKKMFGGIAYMLRGHMACGIVGDELMVRVGPEAYDDALARPHARLMDFTGRPMTGMVMVGKAAIAADSGLRDWVEHGLAYAGSLPPRA
jgi:hypothetical protein